MKEPKVGDYVDICVPSMQTGGYQYMGGYVSEILYDGSVNISKDMDGKIPVAYGQKLQSSTDQPGVVDFDFTDIPF